MNQQRDRPSAVPPRSLPEFASADWYLNPNDHRCPHDAWLESLEVTEPAEGTRREKRQTAVTVRLLGAYHDGTISFRYVGVKKLVTTCEAADRGLGDWLEDQLTIDGEDVVHEITWERGSWTIVAKDISYEWLPNKS